MPGKKRSSEKEPVRSSRRVKPSPTKQTGRTGRARPSPAGKRSSERSTEWEKNFSTLLHFSPIGLGLVTRNGVAVDANDAFLQMLGYRADEVVGRDVTTLDIWVNPEVTARMGALVRSGAPLANVETQWRTRSGEVIDILLSVERIRVGGQLHLLGIVTDVSARRRAEAALLENQARLARILSSITNGYYVLDANWCFVEVNPVSEKHFRHPASELLGRNIWQVAGTPTDSLTYKEFHRAVEVQAPLHFEVESGMNPGRWSELHLYPRNGRLEVYHNDITQRKVAEAEVRRSEEQARELIRYAPTAIYEIDFTGPRFTSVNDAMCALSGYSREELLAMNPFDLLDDESKRVFAERVRKTLAGEKPDESVEYRVLGKGGREIYALLNTTFTYKDGKPGGAFVIAHDVTERRATELERQELLERERAARAQADAAVEVRDRFISVASHELRTPLTSIKGYAELLMRRGEQARLDEEFLRMAHSIEAQSARLDRMISGLLDSSRIEVGQFAVERAPLDLSALVERMVADQKPHLPRHTLVFQCDDPGLSLEGDEARLEQVVQNLIDNAVKYSPAGGNVTVRLWSEGGSARLSVADKGIGIPAGELPGLFTRFHRLRNAQAAHIPGLGVGLYVVQEIVRLHGGTITVESGEGEGSTFTVILPLPRG